MSNINQVARAISTVIKDELSFTKLIDNVELGVGAASGEPISILKALNKCVELGGNVTNLLFYNKLRMFLEDVSSIPYNKRIIFLDKYVNGKEDEFSKKLIEEIDSISDSNKVKFISNSFKAMVNEEISLNEFYRIIGIIKSATYEDLLYMKENIDKKNISANINTFALYNLGLMYTTTMSNIFSSVKYDFTPLAKSIVDNALTWGEGNLHLL